MSGKPLPNHELYLAALRAMTPAQRLAKAFELTEQARLRFRQGLRQQFPELAEAEFQALYLERLAACHDRNY